MREGNDNHCAHDEQEDDEQEDEREENRGKIDTYIHILKEEERD